MPVCSDGRQYRGQMGAYRERNGNAELRFINSLGGPFYFFKDNYILLKAAIPSSFPLRSLPTLKALTTVR